LTKMAGRRLWAMVLGFALIGSVRLWLCAVPPAETTDVLRNLGYGAAFWRHGLAVYDMRPRELTDAAWHELWPGHTYDYPVVTLLFFAVLARLGAGVAAAKVALTLIELTNALLILRLTRSRALATLYWASPASLYWVSREGQFEPLAVFAILVMLDALARSRMATAGAWLAIAIQTKLFPIVLAPLLFARDVTARAGVGFVAALAPSLAALAAGPYLGRMFEAGYWPSGFNPFAWNAIATGPFDWMPRPLIAWEAVLSYALLAASIGALIHALGRRSLVDAAGALPVTMFMVALKSMGWGQFWYLLLVPALALPVRSRPLRTILFVLAAAEGRALSALLLGPIGNPQWFAIDAWM